MDKSKRLVFIPDNVPGHLFQVDEDNSTDDLAMCRVCNLELSTFLSHPYPIYDRLKSEEFHRAKRAWNQGFWINEADESVSLRKPVFVNFLTDASKWAVFNWDSSRPIHFFDSEEQARGFLRSHYRSWFESAESECKHRISETGDHRVAGTLLIKGFDRGGDGWQHPVPIVSPTLSPHPPARLEGLAEYFASVGKTRNLDEIEQLAYMSIKIGDAFNAQLEPVTCYLHREWNFADITVEAESLPGHQVEDIEVEQSYECLRDAACDFDLIIRNRFPNLCQLSRANFLTSLQLFTHFEQFATEQLAGRDHNVNKARFFLHRRLTGYANKIRLASSAPVECMPAERRSGKTARSRAIEKDPQSPEVKILAFIEQEGYTIKELAGELKVSREALSSAINGRARHGKALLVKLANKMNIDPQGLGVY